jgi:hypothetical protein
VITPPEYVTDAVVGFVRARIVSGSGPVAAR